MKRLLTISILLAISLAFAGCGAKGTENSDVNNWVPSDEDLAQVIEAQSEAYINGEALDEDSAGELMDSIEDPATPLDGLPTGFPNSLPIYSGAQLFEAEEYGDSGYTLIYMVPADYDSVVSFYQQSFPGIEKEYDEPDECYFENFDIDGGKVHINGLTITDNDEMTAVFVTLKYN